eukprot:TRINITY_DN4659_c0_g1_i1.p1 TRINITY_DN4659_c0_g1~~TRINITY_DN4659_c0_g1_i1.p1  ORF type:complete len:232 (-),score=74.65 TRINITY_DN4659_c0_g1_i1:9-704(-)
MPSYWKKKCKSASSDTTDDVSMLSNMTKDIVAYEAVKDDKGDVMISLRALTKTFSAFGFTAKSRAQKKVRAVQQVSLDMYKGEVFALLGHNGAGKTTTIGMMTGLLQVTDGNAWILGHDVSDPSAMSEIRKHLGVCPQHDVLWDKLTAREHLWLFARLKGVPESRVQSEVDKALNDTGLNTENNGRDIPYANEWRKRNVSYTLGIALIGGSQICFWMNDEWNGYHKADELQ